MFLTSSNLEQTKRDAGLIHHSQRPFHFLRLRFFFFDHEKETNTNLPLVFIDLLASN